MGQDSRATRMPGRSSASPLLIVIGLAVAAIAFVGTAVFGWEFGATSGPVPVVIGVACAILGVVVYLRQ